MKGTFAEYGTALVPGRSVGHRRKVVNCVPFLGLGFLPWITYLVVFTLISFKLRYVAPLVAWLVCGVILSTCFIVAYNSKKLVAVWIGRLTFGYGVAACILGDMNYWVNLFPFYEIHHLATYVGINPSSRNGRATSGKRYQDAGKVYFNPGTKVDVSRAMSFKMKDTFCVAPIIDPSCAATISETVPLPSPNCGFDFWAVGRNCCADDDQIDFRCGNGLEGNPSPGAVRFVDAESNYWWIAHPEAERFFRYSIAQASGVHRLGSVKEPLFFTFMDKNVDPVEVVANYGGVGYRNLIVGIFLLPLNLLISFIISKKIIL